MSGPLPRLTCSRCQNTGFVERTMTVDHILTDTQPWGYCDCAKGRERREAGASLRRIMDEDRDVLRRLA